MIKHSKWRLKWKACIFLKMTERGSPIVNVLVDEAEPASAPLEPGQAWDSPGASRLPQKQRWPGGVFCSDGWLGLPVCPQLHGQQEKWNSFPKAHSFIRFQVRDQISQYLLCYAKSLQSCPTLCDPIDSSLSSSPVPGILQARTLEWVAISFSNAWKWKETVKLLSRVWLLATPWTAAYQAPPSMGFSRQEYYI